MASIKEIHELVSSLSLGERRFVVKRINAVSGKAKENYITVLQVFTAHSEQEAKQIKLALTQEVKSRNLSELNTNLYHFILDTLTIFHQKKLPILGFLHGLKTAEILFKKGLIAQAKKKVLTLEKSMSKGFEQFSLSILSLKDKIELHEKFKENSYDRQIERIDKQLESIDVVRNKLEFQRLKRKFFKLLARYGSPKNEEHISRYQQLDSEGLLKSPHTALSPSALYYYYDLKGMLYISTCQNELAYKVSVEGLSKVRALFKRQENIIPEFYLAMRSLEYCVICDFLNDFDERIQAFLELKPFLKDEGQLAIFSKTTHWAWLLYYHKKNKIEEGLAYAGKHIDSDLEKGKMKLSKTNYIIHFIIARMEFLKGDYQRALDRVSILIANKAQIRPSLLPPIYCLYLLLHYKLDNKDYLPYAIRSLYRALKKSDSMNAPELAVIQFLRSNTADLKTALQKLYLTLSELSNDKFNAHFFQMGDYLVWIEEELK